MTQPTEKPAPARCPTCGSDRPKGCITYDATGKWICPNPWHAPVPQGPGPRQQVQSMTAREFFRTWTTEPGIDPEQDWPMRFAEAYAAQIRPPAGGHEVTAPAQSMTQDMPVGRCPICGVLYEITAVCGHITYYQEVIKTQSIVKHEVTARVYKELRRFSKSRYEDNRPNYWRAIAALYLAIREDMPELLREQKP